MFLPDRELRIASLGRRVNIQALKRANTLCVHI